MKGIKKIINSERGKILFSILLGFGLATLFRKSCESNNCLIFKIPKLEKIDNKIFQHNDKCYNFTSSSISCSNIGSNSKILEIEN